MCPNSPTLLLVKITLLSLRTHSNTYERSEDWDNARKPYTWWCLTLKVSRTVTISHYRSRGTRLSWRELKINFPSQKRGWEGLTMRFEGRGFFDKWRKVLNRIGRYIDSFLLKQVRIPLLDSSGRLPRVPTLNQMRTRVGRDEPNN